MAESSAQDKRGWYRKASSIGTLGLQIHVRKLYKAGKVKKDYPYLEQMIKDGQNLAAIMKAFGINYRTARGWLAAYKNEHKREDIQRGVHENKTKEADPTVPATVPGHSPAA